MPVVSKHRYATPGTDGTIRPRKTSLIGERPVTRLGLSLG
jgi:hypothetical protein